MAILWSLPVLLFSSLILATTARPPGLYYPPPAGEEVHHGLQSRSHLDDAALSPLSENELETLLYLLDKVQRPPVTQHHVPTSLYGDRRNKRTGAHHLGSNSMPAAKRASRPTDWSDYFGIDKREVKVLSPVDLLQVPQEKAPLTTTPKETAQSEKPREKTDKEREDILREFYNSMAMSANVKRKREIKSGSGSNRIGKEMEDIGDGLIWDALKLTGSHRDEKMSKSELEHLKKQLIQRIGAAYSLEKLRQVLDGGNNNNSSNNLVGQ